MDPTISARLRDLPSVSAVLNTSPAATLIERYGQTASTHAIRATIELARSALQKGEPAVPSAEGLALESRARLEREDRSGSRPLFNLTGTVLHTNLGRAVLAEAAVEAAVTAMQNPVALEFDLDTGKRGERDDHVRGLLCDLTGAEDATIVNNNAAAVLLVLNTLASGREVIVSRGELIEIGGAFRMPEIMASAGARLVEVGTTNRTHMKDYRSALNERTGLILKVHTSNYRIQGFTAEVGTAELSACREGGGRSARARSWIGHASGPRAVRAAGGADSPSGRGHRGRCDVVRRQIARRAASWFHCRQARSDPGYQSQSDEARASSRQDQAGRHRGHP